MPLTSGELHNITHADPSSMAEYFNPVERPIFGALPDGTILRLRLHPELLTVPGWEVDTEFHQLVASVMEQGVMTPLLVHPTGEMDTDSGAEWAEVYDGRHRFSAYIIAEGWERGPLPCAETERPVNEVIITTLAQRRHLLEGARAYLIYPLLAPAIEASKARRIANLKTGKSRKAKFTPIGESGAAAAAFLEDDEAETDAEKEAGETLVTLAEKHAVARESLKQARRLYQHFADFPEDRADWEASLLSGRVKLSAMMAGIGGRLPTKGQKRAATAEPSALCDRFLKSFRHNFNGERWHSYPLAQRAKIQETLVSSVMKEWPAEVVTELRDALKSWKPSAPAAQNGNGGQP